MAVTVRFAGISFDSLWLDESYQSVIGATGHGVADLLTKRDRPYLFRFEKPASVDAVLYNFRKVDALCPPLYAVSLNRWMTLFGDSDLALRSLSALFSLLSIGVVFAIAAYLFGVEAGLAAAFVQALSPFDVHYAQEARMYSLVVLMSALSCGSLTGILSRKWFFEPESNDNVASGIAAKGKLLPESSPDQIALKPPSDKRPNLLPWQECLLLCSLSGLYVVSACALINSHYTGLFIVFFQAVLAGGWSAFTKRWRIAGVLVAAFLLIATLWLPWLPMFLQSASSRKESFYVSRQASFWWPFYALFFKIPVNWEVFLCGPRVGGCAIPLYISAALALVSSAVAGLGALLSYFVTDYGAVAKRLTAEPGVVSPGGVATNLWKSSSATEGRSSLRPVGVGHEDQAFQQVSAPIIALLEPPEKPDKRPRSQPPLRSTGSAADGLTALTTGNWNLTRGFWSREKGFLLAIWLWAIVPAVVLWFLDVLEGRKVIEIARYTIGTAPAVYILAGLGMLLLSRRFRFGWLIFAVHAIFAFSNLFYLHTVHQREPWKEMAATVERVCRPDDLILVSEYYDIACLDRYLSRPFQQVGASPAMGKSYVCTLIAGKQRFVLITAQEGEFIKDLFPDNYVVTNHIDLRHGLHLRVYETKSGR